MPAGPNVEEAKAYPKLFLFVPLLLLSALLCELASRTISAIRSQLGLNLNNHGRSGSRCDFVRRSSV